jgi:peptidoglycan hydrolase CwlO-like protein
MTAAPHPLEKAAGDFLATHQKWVEQTEQEIAALRTRNFKQGTDTLKKKTSLSDTYHRQLKFLHEHRTELMDLPMELKLALRKSQEEFAAISAALDAELKMTMKVAERFMNLIKKSIARQLQTSQFYGRTGNMLKTEVPRSVTVNKKA